MTFYVTSPNSITMNVTYINPNIAQADGGDPILRFDANAASGNVLFTISGLVEGEVYTITRSGTIIANLTANPPGRITFTNSVWSEHEFEVSVETASIPLAVFPMWENFSIGIINFAMNTFAPVQPWLYPFVIIGVIGYVYSSMESVSVTLVAILITFGTFAGTTNIFAGVPAIVTLFYIIAILGITLLLTTVIIKKRRG